MQKASLKDYLQLHLIVIIWGFTAILGKEISIPAVELVFFRTFLAFILLGFIIYFQRKPFNIGKREILKVFGTGLLIAAHWILFFAAARVANVSACLIGMATSSLWTSILEPVINRKKISILEVALSFAVIAGLGIIFSVETRYTLGIIMAIVSALLASVFSIINGRLVKRHEPFTITFYEMIGAFIGTAAFLPFYSYYFAENQTLQLSPTISDWFYIAVLAWVCTVYAYSMAVKLLRKFTAFTMNLTVNLEPVYGIILAVLIYGEKEKMTLGFYFGGVVILLAVLLYPVLSKRIARSESISVANPTEV